MNLLIELFQIDTLEKIKDSGVAPAELWYLSTLILTGILVMFIGVLIFFVKSFFTRLQTTMDSFAESIHDLKVLIQVHDSDIKNIKTRLDKRRS